MFETVLLILIIKEYQQIKIIQLKILQYFTCKGEHLSGVSIS